MPITVFISIIYRLQRITEKITVLSQVTVFQFSILSYLHTIAHNFTQVVVFFFCAFCRVPCLMPKIFNMPRVKLSTTNRLAKYVNEFGREVFSQILKYYFPKYLKQKWLPNKNLPQYNTFPAINTYKNNVTEKLNQTTGT